MMELLSPVDGRPLRSDSPHSLTDGSRRWPVIDGIPFLRTNRETLAKACLLHLDDGHPDVALALLLADQDDWWSGPVAAPEALRRLIHDRDRLSLREAMTMLQWGRVGDYFSHRWTDPTFLAGLALTEAHWNQPATAFELACGIGHHLRALQQQGVSVTGGDIVFAKLWVARHWIVQDASLICFDAASGWPIGSQGFDLVTCHDAFYFLEPKDKVFARMQALVVNGTLLISHIHNRDWPNLSAGSAMSIADLQALAPDGTIYDDAELTRALIEQRAPRTASSGQLHDVEAFALAAGAPAACIVEGRLGLPRTECVLRRNPLYGTGNRIAWPSERYRDEYAARATYPAETSLPLTMARVDAPAESVRRREVVDLPERWG